MNRRGFLKSIGKVVAGAMAVPSLVKGKEPIAAEDVDLSLSRLKYTEPLNPNIANIDSQFDEDLLKKLLNEESARQIRIALMMYGQKVVYKKPSAEYDRQQIEALILKDYRWII